VESSEKKLPAYVLWDSARRAQVHILPIGEDGIRVKIVEHYALVEGRWSPTGDLSLYTTRRS
jgi:hypothetical protein